MEYQERICEKCGKEFDTMPESNSNYNGYCSKCFKIMIQRNHEDDYREW